MKKNDGWMNALFALIFIATPAITIFYFILPTWSNKEVLNYGMIWVVAIAFIIYAILFSTLLILLNILSIESLNFNIPIAFALMSILVTYPLPLWATGVIVIGVVLMAFPMNMLTTKIKINLIHRNK
ncbi:MAG: hypothetical protein KAG14_01165 [Mycoplasmataceae bacterium]|nr:hypothetical protein [Mycoplasmataceae bacterium]